MTTVTSAVVAPPAERERARKPKPVRWKRWVLYTFLTVMALLWLTPVLWAFYTSLRPYADTAANGYVSIAKHLTLHNYTTAWKQADYPLYLKNSLIVTIPAVALTLLLASFVAFAVSRFSWKFNITILILLTAGNLLPQQVIINPLFRLFIAIPLPSWLSDSGSMYDSYLGLIMIHTAFQVGFCTFVLSNYMKTLPVELTEAAMLDGASVWRQYRSIIMPLCRAPLAALATLLVTWIYNDFFWALVLIKTGSKRPITSALNNLAGQYFTDNNLVAAGALLAAVPTMIVYFALQKQFVSGLTLGANKG